MGWPFAGEHRIDADVARLALQEQALALGALIDETETVGRLARSLVGRGACPFKTPVAEVIEDMVQDQVERLGGQPCALQRRRVEHIAKLDDMMGGSCLHEAEPSQRLVVEAGYGEEGPFLVG